MNLVQVIPAFALTALLLAMVPGQGVAMILRQSLVGGSRAATYSVLGNSGGLIIWGAASAIGLSAIFAQSPFAFSLLKWAGVIFLVGLSIQTLWELRKESGKFEVSGKAKTSFFPALRLGLLTNLTNVKAAVFAVAFIPQFVPKDFNLGWGIFILSCVQSATSMTWYFSLIAVVEKSSAFLSRPRVRRILTAVSAGGILVLALGLALSHPR